MTGNDKILAAINAAPDKLRRAVDKKVKSRAAQVVNDAKDLLNQKMYYNRHELEWDQTKALLKGIEAKPIGDGWFIYVDGPASVYARVRHFGKNIAHPQSVGYLIKPIRTQVLKLKNDLAAIFPEAFK